MRLADSTRVLEEQLRARPDASALIPRLVVAAEKPGSPAFRAAYAAVPRRLGAAAREPVALPDLAELARAHWTLTDATRAFLLLLALSHVERDAQYELVSNVLEGGEIGEQESLLRTLILVPEPERFADVGVAACRTNTRQVFEAIACENAFPSRHFPDLGFNQMVLKAIFIEVPVERIEGLDARVTPELARMAASYASERRAAGRPVPEDVDLILNARTEP